MPSRSLFERLETEGWKVVEELVASKTPESVWLEFKTKSLLGDRGKLHDDDKKNLAKAISAFANTEGGLLVFGVSTKAGRARDDSDRAESVQRIDLLGSVARSVEAILRDVTNPAVRGIDLLAIEDGAGSDQGIVAIRVPQSIGGPHRANMGPGEVREHYYQRSATRSDVMPHSILAALMGRGPTAQLYLLLTLWTEDEKGLRFLLELGNAGRGSARQPAIKLFETEAGLRSFWQEAFSSTQLGEVWRPSRTGYSRDEQTAFLASDHDTIVYPGDRLLLTENGAGKFPGGWRWGTSVDFGAKGVLYAEDAPPIEFNQRITVRSVTSERSQFYLPIDAGTDR